LFAALIMARLHGFLVVAAAAGWYAKPQSATAGWHGPPSQRPHMSLAVQEATPRSYPTLNAAYAASNTVWRWNAVSMLGGSCAASKAAML